jgi:hypothetical protein
MCLSCLAGFHYECEQPEEVSDALWACCCPPDKLESEVRGPIKDNDAVTDVESTGRKRAAVAYPIEPGSTICEWAKLKFAGGGVNPIIGCNGNFATNRHHGPDKSTLNNERGNVHRICPTCHNRWHTVNDEHYGDRPPNGNPFLPLTGSCKGHDGETQASVEEIFNNEMSWRGRKVVRASE